MKRIILITILTSVAFISTAQFKNSVFAGIGMGLDYGGVGTQINYFASDNIKTFIGIGYNFNGAGFNIGSYYSFLPENKFSPKAGFMYGYNAVIVIMGREELNKSYYGPSLAIGGDLMKETGHWNFQVILPFRKKAFYDHAEEVMAMPDIEFTQALPFTITVGYNWKL